jgi:DNA-binding response OmpR family regulator
MENPTDPREHEPSPRISPHGGSLSGKRIVLIDPDDDLRSLLRLAYERNDGRVTDAATGVDGIRSVYAERPDLVVLDVSVRNGWDALTRIRDLSDVPVLVLTRECTELERVRALHAGADDHVSKPFGLEELLARSEALLRRRREPADRAVRYADPLLLVDFATADARVHGRPLGLSPQEFRLLAAFVRHPDRVLAKKRLLELAWGDGRLPAERVTLYVRYLRAKFAAAGADESAIETIHGIGYKYRTPS